MNTIRHLIACLILTTDERALLISLRKLDKGEQKFFQRAIEAMAQRVL